MKVGHAEVLVPDMLGPRPCEVCNGYRTLYSTDDGECYECEGAGFFRVETLIVPVEGDLNFRTDGAIIQVSDQGNRWHHVGCGKGVRFFTGHDGSAFWSCAVCEDTGQIKSGSPRVEEMRVTLADTPGGSVLAFLKRRLSKGCEA